MGVETAADSLMTRTPDLARSGCLLERRILLVSHGGSPCVQLHIVLSLHKYRAPSKIRVRAEPLRNTGIGPPLCATRRGAMQIAQCCNVGCFCRRNAHAERRERF